MGSLTRLRSRFDRLERRAKGGECDGCTRTAMANVEARYAAREELPDGRIIRGSFQPAPCPDCGTPNPAVPMRIMDAFMSNTEAMERVDKILRARKEKEIENSLKG